MSEHIVQVEADSAEEEVFTVERRQAPRFTLERWLSVRFIVKPNFQPYQGIVFNLSQRGIGVIVSQPIEPGTVLAIQFRTLQIELASIHTVQVRHTTCKSDGRWLLGCRFEHPLPSELLEGLLAY
jgi:hypothetical protein